MPIFMDRHDVSEAVTAKAVAHLHQEDLKIQDKFNCRGLTYWYDDLKKIAFCLVEAPNKEAIHDMHQHAHGEVPNLIIEVDSNIVESFLGRIEDPENTEINDINIINDPAQRTLMVTRLMPVSLVDYSSEQIENGWFEFSTSLNTILKKYDGRLVSLKDGYFLVSFKLANNAVNCAIEIGNDFKNSTHSLKIGLASGVPVAKDKTFFEDTIQLANRLCFIKNTLIAVSSEVKNSLTPDNPDGLPGDRLLHTIAPQEEIFLNKLFDFTERHWQNNELKVDDFGIAIGMSETQLYRKMMHLIGKSPNNFLKEFRLLKALERINMNRNRISEIAFETGFNSLSYFSKCFQKRFKVLPSVYLQNISL